MNMSREAFKAQWHTVYTEAFFDIRSFSEGCSKGVMVREALKPVEALEAIKSRRNKGIRGS